MHITHAFPSIGSASKLYSFLLKINVENTTSNQTPSITSSIYMFYLEKTRLTFSGDYTLIVSKAYFISFTISKATIQLIIHNLNQFNKTNTKNN